MMEWLRQHGAAATRLTVGSAVIIGATLVLAPLAIARIPADYFARASRPRPARRAGHPALRLAVRIGRNVLGWLLVPAGIAMLALPGQGLITLLLGLFLVEFPGKFRLERWIVSRRGVLRAMNWVRAKRGEVPLTVNAPARPRRRKSK